MQYPAGKSAVRVVGRHTTLEEPPLGFVAGAGEGDADGLGESVAEGDALGESVAAGVSVGLAVSVGFGATVTVGMSLGLGWAVGVSLGMGAGSVGAAPIAAETEPARMTKLSRTDAPRRPTRDDAISVLPGRNTHSAPRPAYPPAMGLPRRDAVAIWGPLRRRV
jgi:hypothetical protein